MGKNKLSFPNSAFVVASGLKRSISAMGQTTMLQTKGSTLSLSLLTCWTPSGGGRANPAVSCDALKVDENLVKSIGWDFSLFLEIAPEEMFSPPGTIQSLTSKKTRSSFSLLVKDVAQLALNRKSRGFGGCPPSSPEAGCTQQPQRKDGNLQNPVVYDPVQIRAVQGLVDKAQHHPQVWVIRPCQESNGSC